MSYSINKVQNYLSWFVFFLAIAVSTFLFMFPGQLPRHLLISSSLIAVILSLKNKNITCEVSFYTYFKPWLPWLVGLAILSVYHGLDGFSRYFNAIAIYALLYVALVQIKPKREFLLFVLACISIIFSCFIVFDVITNGLSRNILGLNKNILIPLTTLTNIACLASLFTRNFANKFIKFVIVASILLALTVLVLSEVRTALVAYISFLPILYYFAPKTLKNRYLLIFSIGSVFLVSLFFLTGRIQQGISDLLSYSSDTNSSLGIRLELWKAALSAFPEAPIFGRGPHFEISDLSSQIPEYALGVLHLHSDYFQFLTIGGLVGVVSWIATCCLFIISSRKDACRLAILIASLSMALSEKFWNYWMSLISLSILLALFYLTDEKENPQTP